MVQVELRDVIKRYDSHHVDAVRGVSLSIASGEFVALMGPSGCGKSTLLNLIGGMDAISQGQIRVGNKEIAILSELALTEYRQKDVGFVFQFFNLLPTLTVLENVQVPLILAKKSELEAKKASQKLLSDLGLVTYLSFYPAQLSGGQMQRVAIARALIHKPALILADEPTGNLDTENGLMVLETLKSQSKRLGITVLMATHSMEAAAFADRICIMRDGKLQDA